MFVYVNLHVKLLAAKMAVSQTPPLFEKVNFEKGFNDGLTVDFCWSCHYHA